jgi:hypothetical protein
MATNDDATTTASAAAGTPTEDLQALATIKNEEEPVEAGENGPVLGATEEEEVDEVHDVVDEPFQDALRPEDSILEEPKESPPAEDLLLSSSSHAANDNNIMTGESPDDTTGVPAPTDGGSTNKVEAEEVQEDKTLSTSTTTTLIWEPADADVLSGRGASVNAHGGNKKFRALCFVRKPEFDAGNHAAKRRIAHEIVMATLGGPSVMNNGESGSTATTTTTTTTRFLKRKDEKGPWTQMTIEQAILKACQVMRDYKRPDRVAIREMMTQSGNARKRPRTTESTPILEIVSLVGIGRQIRPALFLSSNQLDACISLSSPPTIRFHSSPCPLYPWHPLLKTPLVYMTMMFCVVVVPLSMVIREMADCAIWPWPANDNLMPAIMPKNVPWPKKWYNTFDPWIHLVGF